MVMIERSGNEPARASNCSSLLVWDPWRSLRVCLCNASRSYRTLFRETVRIVAIYGDVVAVNVEANALLGKLGAPAVQPQA